MRHRVPSHFNLTLLFVRQCNVYEHKRNIYSLGFWVYFFSFFVYDAKWPSFRFITGNSRCVTKHLHWERVWNTFSSYSKLLWSKTAWCCNFITITLYAFGHIKKKGLNFSHFKLFVTRHQETKSLSFHFLSELQNYIDEKGFNFKYEEILPSLCHSQWNIQQLLPLRYVWN